MPGTVISIVALSLSAFSIWLSWFLWQRSNRPIVTAAVVMHSSGNRAIVYTLSLINSGNRPARDVRIRIDPYTLKESLREDAQPKLVDTIYRCFDDDAVLPLLIDGHQSNASFGTTGPPDATWEWGTKLPVIVEYQGLDGRRFRQEILLVIRDVREFSGLAWSKKRDD